MELYELSAARIASGISSGDFSASDVFEACLNRARSLETHISALLTVTEEEGRCKAKEIDEARAAGKELAPLAGVPFVLKDNMCTRGIPTTCASKILGQWKPPYNAAVFDFLNEAGAVLLGKANLDEFAMGGTTENSIYGPTSNPWDYERVPGGSSGGSAAAVAAGYVPFALGSDTGGSIRQPASFCGVYGFKPTYGLVSRWGLIAFASSLDQIGPFTRTAEDIALILNTIGKSDERDSTCSRRPRPDYTGALCAESLAGKKIGVVKELEGYALHPDIRATFDTTLAFCKESGAEIVEISLPTTIGYGLACYYILAPAEASSNLARFDGVRYGLSTEADSLIDLYMKTRAQGLGPEVKRRILIGTYVLSSGYYDAYYLVAQKVRQLITQEFKSAFGSVDAVLLPTAPTPAFKKGSFEDDPIQMYLTDVFTLPVNLAGLPALSLNGGYTSEGLPIGMQFIAPRWAEESLLSIASVHEKTFGAAPIAKGGAR
ncbi:MULTISPECIES: Asp-tRNA(Asn)/Glu-tRNA(Gln) amidotransferase subunit GatA [Aminobacterium]|jgi:aspartyl-tRNA(Asn)/glutamyl-tRNA(Gln) amidotransferase subunit A|uniref:Asp-tRNA(Asn)/Glu-tRNA(Gln) amidotransferase subunit GatA n=1 Tax=Aminobacterium TaxID=81466 RepID=UPI00257BB7B3|nr:MULTISPECIES: Asp-tRNA(Asn)/Glu-tRNA(Gln) amidotransferase subunit GatA [unclassified Aminobacterium]